MTINELRGKMLDVPTLARFMGVCPMTIYRHLKRRDPIPGHKVGGKYLFFRDEVERWLRNR